MVGFCLGQRHNGGCSQDDQLTIATHFNFDLLVFGHSPS